MWKTACLVLTLGGAWACSDADANDAGDDGDGGADAATAGSSGASGRGTGGAGSGGGGGSSAGRSAGNGSAGTDSGTAGRTGEAGDGGTGAASAGRGTSGSGNGGGSGGDRGEPPEPDAELSPFIVVDQFGYLPVSKKVAVVRIPVTGFDSGESFEPGATYALVDAFSGETVLSGAPTAWRDGAVDESSGDQAYWFDFSSIEAVSSYYVLDEERGVRSPVFDIASDVYREVLRHALRTFFYQRAGFEKTAEFAGAGWADGASHVGPGQDREARLFSAKEDASTARDVSGGWYDAGDYNKYTNWHAAYVVQMLRAYRDRMYLWGDDSGIPESGNGVPDILDEALFGLAYLERLQEEDGSVLSIVGLASASPPSSATEPSFYGPPSTSATASAAAAFAYAALVFEGIEVLEERADAFRSAAERAYAWASANPSVVFRNNDAGSGSSGLGAGQQETDDKGRTMKRLEAACYLYELTGDTSYRSFFDENYATATLLSPYAYAWEEEIQEMLLHYSALPGATESVATAIRSAYATALESAENLPAHRDGTDPYLAPLSTYTWGSNAVKAHQGLVFQALVNYDFPDVGDDVAEFAQSYLHYLHGVNPLGLAYLSNMSGAGAEHSANEFFHTWFADGSALWDRAGESMYGPPPGFLTGGPNPSYAWDGCCPSGCSGVSCGSAPPSPPTGQPPQKSYLDFNTSWPLNSWAVTENSNGYQIAYIRLLSQFTN